MSDIIGYINFNPLNNSVPSVFNPSNFVSSSIISSNISSGSVNTNYINSNNGNITGNPIPNSSAIATTQYVDAKISSLIGSSPELLNNLQEINQAINNDPNFNQTILNQISLKADKNNPVLTGTLLLNNLDLGTLVNNNITDISNLQTRATTDENNISTNTNNITNLQTSINTINNSINDIQTKNTNQDTSISNLQSSLILKQDKSNSIYTSTWYLNANINKLSDILNSIGSLTSQCINVSCSGHSDTQSPVVISKVNLTICGPDCAFSSPSSNLSYPILINGSSTTRIRISNIQFEQSLTIDGTQGRHVFKACVFNNNFTVLNTTTNWIIFYYCSFAGQINIPITFGGYIIFYFCDFAGAILNFNNYSNQQILINSCSNLPSFNLNALLNGFNNTTTSSGITTSTLNVSSSISLPSNSISISNITGLQTALDTKALNSSVIHNTGNENIDGIKTFTSTPLINSYNIATTNDISTAISNLINSAPSTLDTLGEIATQLKNDESITNSLINTVGTKANDNSVVHLTNTETITGQKTFNNNLIIGTGYNLQTQSISLNGTDLNTRLTTDETSITNLQSSKQDILQYDTVPTLNSSKLLNSGSLYSALSSYVLSSGLTSILSSYVLSSSLTSILSSYLTTATASATYQPIGSYDTLNTQTTITGNKIFNNSSTFSRILENITAGTITSNILTIDFSSSNSVVYVSPSSNFTINLINIPSGTQTNSYSFTIWSSAKFYGNVIQVSGTSQTIISIGGASNISTNINSSATNLLQQITLIYVNSSTPIKCLTNIASIF